LGGRNSPEQHVLKLLKMVLDHRAIFFEAFPETVGVLLHGTNSRIRTIRKIFGN
jgi:hypothetical protein